MDDERKFKVLKNPRTPSICPDSIPWAMVEPHREQARKNHYQTLEQLDYRGGLGVNELYAVLQNQRHEYISEERAIKFLLDEIREFYAKQARK